MNSPQHRPGEAATGTDARNVAASGTSAGAAALPFAPLPLRARGVLETFDVAVRVFKRYFKVLVGWSAFVAIVSGVSGGIVSGTNNLGPGYILGASALFGRLMSSIMLGSFLSLLLWPLVIGAVACCLAAAVRGQHVSFGQCWQFTKPRYWGILGSCILAGLMALVIGFLAMIVFTVVVGFGSAALATLSTATAWIAGVLGFLAFLIIPGCLISLVGTWFTMVPIVVCMEDDKRNSSSLGRASELLSGNWKRALSLGFMLGLAIILFSVIVQATSYLLGQLPRLMGLAQGTSGGEFGWGMLFITTLLSALMSAITTPFSFLVVALFYLDLRVRKEALDLEWAAHTTAPAIAAAAPAATPAFNLPPMATSDFHSPFAQPDAASSNAASLDVASATPDFAAATFAPAASLAPVSFDATFSAPPFGVPNASESFLSKSDDVPVPSAQHATDRLPQQTPSLSDTSSSDASSSIVETVFSQKPVVRISKAPLPNATSAPDALLPVPQVQPGTWGETFVDVPPTSQSTDASSATAPDMSTHAAASRVRACPQCGAQCSAQLAFCMQCGARLPKPDAR